MSKKPGKTAPRKAAKPAPKRPAPARKAAAAKRPRAAKPPAMDERIARALEAIAAGMAAASPDSTTPIRLAAPTLSSGIPTGASPRYRR